MCYRCEICSNVVPNSITVIVRPETVHYASGPITHPRKVCMACRDAIDKGIPIATLRLQAERAAALAEPHLSDPSDTVSRAMAPMPAVEAANNLRFGISDPFTPMKPMGNSVSHAISHAVQAAGSTPISPRETRQRRGVPTLEGAKGVMALNRAYKQVGHVGPPACNVVPPEPDYERRLGY